MNTTRKLIIAALALAAFLVAAAPSARAATWSVAGMPQATFTGTTPLAASGKPFSFGTGFGSVITGNPCGVSSGDSGQGSTGGVDNVVCNNGGLTFVGPAVGQIASVIGPTIIGGVITGSVLTSAGDASVQS